MYRGTVSLLPDARTDRLVSVGITLPAAGECAVDVPDWARGMELMTAAVGVKFNVGTVALADVAVVDATAELADLKAGAHLWAGIPAARLLEDDDGSGRVVNLLGTAGDQVTVQFF